MNIMIYNSYHKFIRLCTNYKVRLIHILVISTHFLELNTNKQQNINNIYHHYNNFFHNLISLYQPKPFKYNVRSFRVEDYQSTFLEKPFFILHYTINL